MKVYQPCPIYLSKRNKTEGGYFCSSCDKCIVDFRGKSMEEIKAVATPDTCGIFTRDQLSSVPVMPLPRRVVFSLLTVVSFLGFHIQPVRAQQEPNLPRETPSQAVKTDPSGERKVAPQTCTAPVKEEKKETEQTNDRRKGRKSRRRETFRVTGCPAF